MATPDYQVTTDQLFETAATTITEAGNIARRIGINPVPNLREKPAASKIPIIKTPVSFDDSTINICEKVKFSRK